jgi:hypothetical protein
LVRYAGVKRDLGGLVVDAGPLGSIELDMMAEVEVEDEIESESRVEEVESLVKPLSEFLSLGGG